MTEQTDGMQLSGEIKGLKWNMKRMIEKKKGNVPQETLYSTSAILMTPTANVL